jgi:hypothetical protein
LKKLRRDAETIRGSDRGTRRLSTMVPSIGLCNADALECIIVILELCSPSRCCRIWIVRM